MESLKILVVDDESRMRKLVKDFLTKKGFTVIEAGDGEEAVDKFFEVKDIALIILDVMMPKMDGYQLAKLIRKKDDKLPIIMLTALEEEYDEIKGFEIGADDYITKPFSFNVLLRRVNAILKRTKNERKDSKGIREKGRRVEIYRP